MNEFDTPVEHLIEARKWLARAGQTHIAHTTTMEFYAIAQVHATLASVDPRFYNMAREREAGITYGQAQD